MSDTPEKPTFTEPHVTVFLDKHGEAEVETVTDSITSLVTLIALVEILLPKIKTSNTETGKCVGGYFQAAFTPETGLYSLHDFGSAIDKERLIGVLEEWVGELKSAYSNLVEETKDNIDYGVELTLALS